MKTVFSSHAELCHQFAANPQGSGRATNMSFGNGALYSYGTCIMRVMNHKKHGDFLLVNSSGYSNSTCKHMGHARSATRHYALVFSIDGLGRGVSLDYTMRELGPKLYACAIDNAARSKQKSIRARTNKAWFLEQSMAELREAQRVSDFFGLRKKVDEKAIENLIKEKDAAAKLHAEEMRDAEQRRKEREAERLKEAEEDLARWVNHQPLVHSSGYFYNMPVKLRVERGTIPDDVPKACVESGEYVPGSEIVTSLGARIPYEDGKRCFQFCMKMREEGWHHNGDSFSVGSYNLDRVSESGVKAGCHFITWDVLMAFAIQEGWIPQSTEV